MFFDKVAKKMKIPIDKRILVLQELGGKFENQYVVAALGQLAQLNLQENDLVICAMRFQCREYNGQMYQDITATELVVINK